MASTMFTPIEEGAVVAPATSRMIEVCYPTENWERSVVVNEVA